MLAVLLFFSQSLFAYPEFIGYGYASCLTCHYNGQGSGPLNDYGRALWSAEIASTALFPKSWSDEEIAERSGFFGKWDPAPWFRPHIKYRELHLDRNPGGGNNIKKFYRMQHDVGAALLTPSQKYAFVFTFGNLIRSGEDTLRLLAREAYLRVEVVKTWWVYVGLMEKAFGIRNIDHESFQRRYQTFKQTLNETNGISHSQGVMVQKVEEKWDVTLNAFGGNPHDNPEFRHQGLSAHGEFSVGENKRLGMSVLAAESDKNAKDIYAIHYRQAVAHGSAVLLEYGLLQDRLTNSDPTTGSYFLLQSMVNVVRGYNWKTTLERYNREFKPSVPDTWRWSTGLLAFPAPRLEVRLEFVNTRGFSDGPVNDDDWTMQGQIHVSL